MRLVSLFLFIALPVIAQPGVVIALVGDSTVNDEGGWGPAFAKRFSPAVRCLNFALNGRSSKSFRDEGRWEPVLRARPDYVLIQFGHNDNPGKGPERETQPSTTYRFNLVRYLDEVISAGATPVLVTSIVRRNFEANGKIKQDANFPYVEEVRKIAAERGVALMDLYTLTLQQAERLGPEGSAALGPASKDGKKDTTHLSPAGQDAIGGIAAREFVRVVPKLRGYLRSNPAGETLR